MPAWLLALVAPSTNLPHRHPWPMMPVPVPVPVRRLASPSEPVRLNKAPCPRSGGIPASPLHSLACFTAPPAHLHHIFPAFHTVSCAYPPTPIAAPWYPREPHCAAPTRTLPTSQPNHRPTVSPSPSPSQPTQTQRLLCCTASTCDPLRRLIDPPCVTCLLPGIITAIATIHLDRLAALPEKP